MHKITKRAGQLRELRSGAYDSLAHSLKRGSGPSSSKQYEKALSRLGMTVLQEQVPELLPYLIGFQLLDKSDEGDFAAGFFVFDVGGVIVDCPIFLIDGKVKGHQLLQLREQGIFMPNQSEIVQYVMTRRDEVLGEESYGENETRPNSANTNFDVYSSDNKFLQKTSSWVDSHDPWPRQSGVVEAFVDLLTNDKAQAIKQAAAKGEMLKPDLVGLLERDDAADQLRAWCNHSPKLASRVAQRLGDNWWAGVQTYRAKRAEFQQRHSGLRVGKRVLKLGSQEQSSKMAAFTDLSRFKPELREQLHDELMELGAVFFDEREGTLKKAMLVEREQSWGVPQVSGVYPVSSMGGQSPECHVFLPTDQIRLKSEHRGTLVVNVADKSVARVSSADLAADLNEGSRSLADAMDGQGARDNLSTVNLSGSKDKVILVFDKRGNVAGPFAVGEGDDDAGYDIDTLYVKLQGSSEPFSSAQRSYAEPPIACGVNFAKCCLPAGSPLKLQQVGEDGYLMIPEDATFLDVTDSSTDNDDWCHCQANEFKVMPLTNLTDELMNKRASLVSRRPCNNVVEINGKMRSDRDTVGFLMSNGLRKEAALRVVIDADVRKRAYFVVDEDVDLRPWQVMCNPKLALRPENVERDSDFIFRDPSPNAEGRSDSMMPVREVYPEREAIVSEGMELGDINQPPMGSERAPYPEPVVGDGREAQQAEQLAEEQDTMFENSLFTSLIGSVDPGSDRERLLAGLMRACDDAGRTLFLTYAHGEQFAEAYGLSDAKDLEEQLLSVFEGAGKLMIMLLNRSVEASHDTTLSSLIDA